MINLMCAGNVKVLDGMIIICVSVSKYCTEPINLFILTMDLQEQNKDFIPISKVQAEKLESILKKSNSDSKVTLIDFTSSYKEEMENGVNKLNRYTPYALLRLYADTMKEIPDKVLYVDTDVVFTNDVSELYSIDVEDYELAGVKDYYGHIFIGRNYINSGVLLLNMKLIRETKMFAKAREMVATKKMLFADQDAINKLVTKKKLLPYRFNEQHKEKEDTVIRHFSKTLKFFPYFSTQNIKPWMVEEVRNVLKTNYFDDILDEYLTLKGEIIYE
ncbi:MAG: glycosyltransferase [Bacilli bacterium]